MARPKKEQRTTKFVTLRKKERAKGIQVLYLDIYIDGKRSYEFLKDAETGRKLYLVPETDEASKVRNQNEWALAQAICSQREIEIVRNGQLQPKAKVKLLLLDWMEAFRADKERTGQSQQRAKSIKTVIQHLKDFIGSKAVTMADVDEDFCKRFIEHLAGISNKNYTKNPKQITAASARAYYLVFVSALNEAVHKKLLPANPAMYLNNEDKKPIKAVRSMRTYLTIDEVRRLIAADCKREQVKRAFLFACFTGLRISDVRNLTWADIKEKNGSKYVSIIIQKTRQPIVLKLNEDALRWMPQGQGKGQVFALPDNHGTLNRNLKMWAKAAGIDKDLCFHMSRHTFATMALTLGADLYTVSKLLGHQDISVTQVYAEIIDEKKDKALDLTNGLFDK